MAGPGSLSGHFLDVMRGLPTLVAFRRAEAQTARIRAVTDRYRVATLRTLRLAFASSAVLELVATLSVALVAVTVGVRLAVGDLGLRTALVVLLLAPEAYWPLRRVGAEFHAAAEGVATFEAVSELLDVPAGPAGSPAERAALRVAGPTGARRRDGDLPRSDDAGPRRALARAARTGRHGARRARRAAGSRPCWPCSPACSRRPPARC